MENHTTAEQRRLEESRDRSSHWKRWGPYLSERAWGTVREDYSATATAWEYLPARPRALPRLPLERGRHRRNLRPPSVDLLRARAVERPRSHPQGAPVRAHRQRGQSRRGREGVLLLPRQHAHALLHEVPLQVPAGRFPYEQLLEENRRRGRGDPEFELVDTGVFARESLLRRLRGVCQGHCEDILIRITVTNRGPEAAELHLLPTIWFRNTWAWSKDTLRPEMQRAAGDRAIALEERAI